VKVKIGTGGAAVIEKMLTDKIRLTNMHCFNSKCVIQKYDSVEEILREFTTVRMRMYRERLAYMLKTLRDKLPYHENVVRFIRQQCEEKPRPELRKKSPEDCDSLLDADKFARIDGEFNYLLNLPIAALTLKHALKHEKDLEELKADIKELESKTAPQLWKEDLEKI
jgi:DNA topoisomerase-2